MQHPNGSAEFWAQVDRSGDCWLWTGSTFDSGYGRFNTAGTSMPAHRFAYIEAVGEPRHTLDHRCHNADASCPGGPSCLHRRCVNPAHLEDVPIRLNLMRGRTPAARNAGATHCKRGHAFDEANTYRWGGGRHCRQCRQGWKEARRAA